MKILAIGDIHRKFKHLPAICKYAKREKIDHMVFLGDYADDFLGNHEDTYKTWEMLRDIKQKYNATILIGNHDYLYLYRHWIYSKRGLRWVQSGFDFYTEFFLMNDHEDLVSFLKSMSVWEEIDDVYYTHGGISQTTDISDYPKIVKNLTDEQKIRLWKNSSPLWLRPGSKFGYAEIPQVFGHTPSETCYDIDGKNHWCCDTFSTEPDGSPYGDLSLLLVTDGKEFKKIGFKDWH